MNEIQKVFDFKSRVTAKLIHRITGEEKIISDDPNYKVYLFRDAVARCMLGDKSLGYIAVGSDNSLPGDKELKNDIEAPLADFYAGKLDPALTLAYGRGYKALIPSSTDITLSSEIITNFVWDSGAGSGKGNTLTFSEFGLFASDSNYDSDPTKLMLARFVLPVAQTKTVDYALSVTWRYQIRWSE